jgi:hypothetical protein
MNLTELNIAIENAYQNALINLERVLPYSIAENVTLQTDIYSSPAGNGFRIKCIVDFPGINFSVARVRNHGPDTASELEWPEIELAQVAKNHIVKCIAMGEEFVNSYGFNADKKIILLNKLLQAKEQNTLDQKPKLSSLYQWFNQIEQGAITGNTIFSPPPYTFEEVLTE